MRAFGVSGQSSQDRQAQKPCWECRETVAVWSAIVPSGTLRMRMNVNMGTKDARLSRVVTPLGRSSDRPKHLPTRRPSGGAPVVVGDVSDVYRAKGCRIIGAGEPRCSPNPEASRWAPEDPSGGSHGRRIVWKAGCLETCTSGLGFGPGCNSAAYTMRLLAFHSRPAIFLTVRNSVPAQDGKAIHA